MLLTLLSLSTAHAEDPWARPEHLRAVAEPPSRYADLDARKVRIRLWWDIEPGASYEIQVQRPSGWKTLTTEATAGWTSRPMPPSTALRVRRVDGEQARWSEPVTAPPYASPTDLARLAGPEGAVLAGGVGQISISDRTTWASVLGGGLISTTADSQQVRTYTRWDGLPADKVIAVHADGDQVLAGTAEGAVLLDGGVVQRVWDEQLPDPYVQSVLIGSSALWMGTYRGLARVSPAGVEDVLTPWSVFSLAEEDSGDIWVGYEGFRQLDAVGNLRYPPPEEADPPAAEERSAAELALEAVADVVVQTPSQEELLRRDLMRLKVYGAALTGSSRWLATENFGLVLYAGDDINPVEGYPTATVYSVAVNAQGVWAAGDKNGLVGPSGIQLGRAEGLPSDTVWSVAGAGSGLWVGTDQGLVTLMLDSSGQVRSILPQAYTRWPADRSAVDLLPGDDGAFVSGPQGVWSVGQPHRAAADLVAAAGQDVVALLSLGTDTWAVGSELVRLDKRGGLMRVSLPAPARSAAVWSGAIWIADGERLWRYDEEKGRVMFVSRLPGVVRLAANQQAIWAISERGKLSRVLLGTSRPFTQVDQVLDARPSDDGYVCVGTEDGLMRLLEDSGDAEDVLGDRDRGARVPAVAVDPAGGCWFAAEDGTVGRTFLDGQEAYTYLPPERVGAPQRIVPDGEDAAWILTSQGTWRVRLPGLGAQ